MKYVYKIIGRFNEHDFNKMLDKISKKFIYMYVDNTLFIALKSWADYEGSKELVDKTFRPIKDFYIDDITEKNIITLAPFIKDWCLNNLVKLDTERYEAENQDKLRQVWVAMDKMEAQLIEELEQKEENEKGGKTID